MINNFRGIEWSIENDASRKISAQSRNLDILNKSLGISGSLHVEHSRILYFGSQNLENKLHPILSNISAKLTVQRARKAGAKFIAVDRRHITEQPLCNTCLNKKATLNEPAYTSVHI